MFSRRKTVFAAASAILPGMLACGLPGVVQAQGAPIKIGFIGSMTGTAATAGFNGIVGATLAAKEINAKGGILGRQVVVVSGDDQSDPTAAVTEARRLVQREKVDFVLGPLSSQITLAMAPIYTEARLAQISVSGSAAITPAVAPYHFSMLPDTDAQGGAIADYIINTLKARSVASIHDSGAQSRGIIEAVKQIFPRRGITITGEEEYALTTTDMTPQLLTLRKGNPDAMVLVSGTGTDTGYVVKSMNDLGWPIKMVANISAVVQPPVTIKVAGPEAFKNLAGINYKMVTYCSNDPVGSSEYTKFVERVKAETGDKFPQYSPTIIGYMYDGLYILKAAAEGSRKTDGPAIAAWLEANASKVKVMTGDLSASKTSHFLVGSSALAMVENADKVRSDGLQKRAGC